MFRDRRKPPTPTYDPTKRKQYSHSETSSTLDDPEYKARIDIAKDGIVTITQGDTANDDYDQVELKAWMIFRIADRSRNNNYISFLRLAENC